ncbi:hypothetical protein YC2023_065819 [Brassica napus]
MIETGQRNFRDTCKGPEKDYYPKSQNTKVEDPESSHSIKPELTSIQSTPVMTRQTLSPSIISDERIGRQRDLCLCLRLFLLTTKSLDFVRLVASSLDDDGDKSRRIYQHYLLRRKTQSYHLKSKGFILGTQGFEIFLILLLSRSKTILDMPVLPNMF